MFDPAYLLAPLVAFAVSSCAAMVGVSGAFLLLPYQVSILGVAGPSASATNLLFNLVATPGGIFRYARAGRLDWRLAADIAAGSLPGLLAGWWLRSHWLLDPARFRVFMGVVLLALAARMVWREAREGRQPPARSGSQRGAILAASLFVGVVGGAYGVGGGAFMAPLLAAAFGRALRDVAGATLLATFASSLAGVAMYALLPAPSGVDAGPDWSLGLLLGVGAWEAPMSARGCRSASQRRSSPERWRL